MKPSFRAVLGCILFLGAVSCNQDVTSLEELVNEDIRRQTVRDSLLRESGRVIYTVHVVDGARATSASGFVAGAGHAGDDGTAAAFAVAGAVVTTAQLGMVTSVTTDATGMAVFPDMRVGHVAVTIATTTHTSASFTADLSHVALQGDDDGVTVDDGLLDGTNILRHAASRIPVFPRSGDGTTTVSGIVTHESDLTDDTSEPVNGLTVAASIVTDAGFLASFINTSNRLGSGQVLSITYGDAITSTSTSSAGAYSLTLPATAQGLPVMLHIADLAVDQTLLLATLNGRDVFGPQVVRTTFTQDPMVTPSTIPAVRPAFVEFDPPSSTGINQPPEIAAAAVAVISNGQVVSVNITNAGSGYTQAPRVVFNSATGTGAAATATLSAGRISEIAVTASGSGYQDITTTLASDGTGATAVADVAFEVTQVNVTNPGANYTAAPTVSFSGGGGGTGATATANMLGVVSSFQVTGAGSNFTKVPTVDIAGGGGSGAAGIVTLTTGPIRSILLPNNADFWFTAAPAITFVGADGAGAAASATLLTTGRLSAVNITNAGSGYTSPPTVAFTGGDGVGAVATAVLGAGGTIASINLVNRGSAFTGVPTVAISGGGGTGATAVVPAIERRIATVSVDNGGHSFTDATTGAHVHFNGAPIPGTQVLLNRSISAIAVGASGSNYTSAPTVTVIGDGTAASVTAEVRQAVASITVTSRGSGYRAAPTVSLTGDGTGATATAVLDNGVIAGVTITNPGSGYTVAPNIIPSGGGPPEEQAVLSTTITGGQVSGVTIVSPGRRYASNPTLAIQTFRTAGAVNANIATGTVIAVNVTNPGRGYKAPPLIEFVSNSGSGAAATAVLDAQGRIQRIDVTDAGSSYASVPALNIVVPNSATRAQGTVTVNAQGVVTGVSVTVPGVGYTSAPVVTISPSVTGVGSGAIAQARVTNGAVTSVVIANGGSGYLGRNTPGNFFPASAATIPGLGYRFSQPGGAMMTLRSGVAAVNDVFLGTGLRQVP